MTLIFPQRKKIVENVRNLKGSFVVLLSLRRFSKKIARDFFLFAVDKAIYAIPGVLHVIQIVTKECVIIILFTQKREFFTLIDFLRPLVIHGLENCFICFIIENG